MRLEKLTASETALMADVEQMMEAVMGETEEETGEVMEVVDAVDVEVAAVVGAD